MKKILFIVQLPPPVHGASLINSYIVGSKMIKDAFSTTVLPLQFADVVADIGKISFKKILLIPVFAFRLFWKLLVLRPHLVYYNFAPSGPAFYRDALYVMLIKASGAKLALHLQGQGVAQHAGKNGWNRWLYKLVFRKTFPVCLAERLYSDIQRIHSGKYYILHCAIPVNNHLPIKKSNGIPVYLFLSNFYKAKGVMLFLETMKVLEERKMDFKAIAIGNSGDITIEEAKSFVTGNGIAGKVHIAGPLYGDEKFSALCAADYFVFPTVNDAFPLTILEAMQCSLVTVSTYTGAIPDMIKDGVNGKLIDSQDPGAWADLLQQLASDPQATKSMAECANKEFYEKYTLDIFEKKLFSIINDIVNSK